MKQLLIILIASICFLLMSCSNSNDEIQNNAKLWLETNIFPLVGSPKIVAFNEVSRIKDKGQAELVANIHAKSIANSFNDPNSLENTAIKDHDYLLLQDLSFRKTLSNSGSEGYNKIVDKGYSVNVIFQFKNWRGEVASENIDVVFSDTREILNPKLVSFVQEGTNTTFYKLEK